ncbi:hypothetical protein [Amycolatopsis sp. NPDC003861]
MESRIREVGLVQAGLPVVVSCGRVLAGPVLAGVVLGRFGGLLARPLVSCCVLWLACVVLPGRVRFVGGLVWRAFVPGGSVVRLFLGGRAVLSRACRSRLLGRG